MDFITAMEWLGTVAFAVSGAVVAIEKKLDWYGICFLAIITAIGGGIIRDVLINQSLPSSLANPMYTIVSLITAVVVIGFYKYIKRIKHIVSIADAFGLSAFTAIGCNVAAFHGYHGFYVSITLAVLTGTFGGVLRDVFVQEIPRCFRREVYAVASIAGAVIYCLAEEEMGYGTAMYLCFCITLGIRLIALSQNLHLGTVNTEKEIHSTD